MGNLSLYLMLTIGAGMSSSPTKKYIYIYLVPKNYFPKNLLILCSLFTLSYIISSIDFYFRVASSIHQSYMLA